MKWYVWLMAVAGVVLIAGGLLYIFVLQDNPEYTKDEVLAIVKNEVNDWAYSKDRSISSLFCYGNYIAEGKWSGSGNVKGSYSYISTIKSLITGGETQTTLTASYSKGFRWNFYEKSGTVEINWE